MQPGKSARALWAEFKAFAFKGNMIDLAVAVVIGAAFSGVIKSLVSDIIMPAVSYAVTGVSQAAQTASDVASKAVTVVGVTSRPADTQPGGTTQPGATTQPAEAAAAAAAPPPPPPPAPAPAAAAPAADPKAVDITWTIGRIKIGNFIGELINFVIIAFAVFIIIVKLLGSVMKKVGGTPAPSEPTTKECPFCLSVIPVKARKCANCTADLPATPTVATIG